MIALIATLQLFLIAGKLSAVCKATRHHVERTVRLKGVPTEGDPDSTSTIASDGEHSPLQERNQSLTDVPMHRVDFDSGFFPGGGHLDNISGSINGTFLRFSNGTVVKFPTCSRACNRCFLDHYQGCLAYCKRGCQTYCQEVLPRPECEQKQIWVAKVSHILEVFDFRARMCQATGVNMCPDIPTLRPEPMPVEPYNVAAQHRGENKSAADRLDVHANDTQDISSSKSKGNLRITAARTS